jgi:hypothetical protein
MMTYKKEDTLYYFNSKHDFLNYPFGVDENVKKSNHEKIEKQNDYLKNTYLEIDGDKHIPLYEVAYGANVKPETYHAEIWHRVKTLQDYANEKGYTKPFFITITPPSHLKPLKQIKLPERGKLNQVKLVDNPNFTGETDYIIQARDYISNKWQKFLRQRIFEDIKRKYGERMIYMRTYEPMMDGTPHAHLMCFIPPEFADRFKQLAINYFNETTFDIRDVFENQKHVIAYILKYILKSFQNAKEGKIDDIGHWYIHNQIRRFTTSRTLVPLKIFRLLGSHEEFQNLPYVNRLYKVGDLKISIAFNPYKLYDIDLPELKGQDYYIASVEVARPDGYDVSFEVLYKKNLNIKVLERSLPTNKTSIPNQITNHSNIPKWTTIKFDKHNSVLIKATKEEAKNTKVIPVYVGKSIKLLNINGRYIPYSVPFKKMKDYQLFQYALSLDIEETNLHHFHAVKNECVKRGLIDGEIQPVEDIDQIIESMNYNWF